MDLELVKSAALELQATSDDDSAPFMHRLMDLKLPIAVVLGQAVWPLREVLKLTSGSLIELDRTVNDYVDLVVHGTVVARGQIVSVKGNYGVRIKRILNPEDRLAVTGLGGIDSDSFEG